MNGLLRVFLEFVSYLFTREAHDATVQNSEMGHARSYCKNRNNNKNCCLSEREVIQDSSIVLVAESSNHHTLTHTVIMRGKRNEAKATKVALENCIMLNHLPCH